MSTRNYVEDLEYLDAKGLDTAAPINLMQQGFVREAINVNLGTTGGYIKRDGYTEQTLVWPPGFTTYVIRAAIQYRNTDSSNLIQPIQTLVFGRNSQNGVFGFINEFAPVSGYNPDQDPEFKPFSRYRSLGGGSYVAEQIDLNQTNRPSFAQIGNGLYYFDGSGEAETPFVYEANTDEFVRPLGIAAPTTIITGTPQIAGSLEVGQYLYSYTYVFIDREGNEIAESSPKGISDTVTTTTANRQVQLSFSAFPDYALRTQNDLQHFSGNGGVKIKLYRTVVNGSILFLLDDPIQGDQSTYTDNIPDASLQAEQISLDNSRLSSYAEYDKARFPVVARNRLLVFHPRQNKGRFSKIGPNGPLPESFPIQNEFSVEGKFGASDAVVGAGQIRGIPIVFKERSIGRLEEVGIPDIGNNEDSVIFVYREISETTGGISHFAQTQVFDELIFLSRDNIYATNGEQVRPIATQIQNIIRRIDFSGSRPSEFSAINDTKNRRIYIQVYKQVGSTNLDLTLVGDYQQYPNFRWTTYEGKPGDAVAPGIVASAFFQTEATLGAGGGLEVYFADAATAGKYYKMNSGQSDDGKDIKLKLVTRPYMFTQPMLKKLYKTAKIWAEAQDTSYQFQFGAIFNLDDNEVISTPFTVPGGGTKWDNTGANTTIWIYDAAEVTAYNTFKAAKLAEDPSDTRFTTPVAPGQNTTPLTWAGNLLNEYKYSVHRKAETMQLVFTQNSKNAPLTLLGWGVSGSIFSGI